MGSVDLDPTGFSGTLDDIDDGTTYKKISDTEKTKLTGIEDGAEANVGEEFTTTEQTKLSGIEDSAAADQTATEVQAALKAMSEDDLEVVFTAPTSGQHKVKQVQRKPTGEINFIFKDSAES